ncbi:hypothetical protein HDZ31DRAFT_68080 [Schizophyllum fasciatum]
MPFDVPSHSHAVKQEMDITAYKPSAHPRSERPSRESRPPSPKTFTYDLTRKGKTWGTLTLLGDPALSRSTPTFVEPGVEGREGARVRGSVALSLESSEAIHSVKVTVRGQLSIGASAPFTFLDASATPWSREMGDPRADALPGIWSGKLRGAYSWPFDIQLPRTVTLPVGSPPRERRYALPANFWERHEPVRVRYHVVLHVLRGTFKGDLRLPVEIAYVPRSAPPPASPARRLAYEERRSIPPPESDVDGWYTPRSVVASGVIAGHHEVEVTCSLSLAKPLCYTRGSVIPCTIVLESHDIAALDLLSSPTAPAARLRRRLRYKSNIGRLLDDDDGDTGWQDSTTVYDLASWWPREGAPQHAYRRCLDGEIHLKEDLRPTTAFAHWRVEYEVVLFPFDVLSFVGRERDPLVVQPVEIATTYGPGPRPRVFTAPAYEFAGHVPVVSGSY